MQTSIDIINTLYFVIVCVNPMFWIVSGQFYYGDAVMDCNAEYNIT